MHVIFDTIDLDLSLGVSIFHYFTYKWYCRQFLHCQLSWSAKTPKEYFKVGSAVCQGESRLFPSLITPQYNSINGSSDMLQCSPPVQLTLFVYKSKSPRSVFQTPCISFISFSAYMFVCIQINNSKLFKKASYISHKPQSISYAL